MDPSATLPLRCIIRCCSNSVLNCPSRTARGVHSCTLHRTRLTLVCCITGLSCAAAFVACSTTLRFFLCCLRRPADLWLIEVAPYRPVAILPASFTGVRGVASPQVALPLPSSLPSFPVKDMQSAATKNPVRAPKRTNVPPLDGTQPQSPAHFQD